MGQKSGASFLFLYQQRTQQQTLPKNIQQKQLTEPYIVDILHSKLFQEFIPFHTLAVHGRASRLYPFSDAMFFFSLVKALESIDVSSKSVTLHHYTRTHTHPQLSCGFLLQQFAPHQAFSFFIKHPSPPPVHTHCVSSSTQKRPSGFRSVNQFLVPSRSCPRPGEHANTKSTMRIHRPPATPPHRERGAPCTGRLHRIAHAARRYTAEQTQNVGKFSPTHPKTGWRKQKGTAGVVAARIYHPLSEPK